MHNSAERHGQGARVVWERGRVQGLRGRGRGRRRGCVVRAGVGCEAVQPLGRLGQGVML